MSFLIDPPWLYATGQMYGRLLPERPQLPCTLPSKASTL